MRWRHSRSARTSILIILDLRLNSYNRELLPRLSLCERLDSPACECDVGILQPLSQQSNCCRSMKCIRGHIPMHEICGRFCLFFLPVLSRLFFTSRTPDKDQKSNSSTFLSSKPHCLETSMSSAVNVLCMPSASAQKSALRKKWHVLVPLNQFP